MRSFELAAMRGCLLVEWTEEHEEIFGQDAAYFRSETDMVEKAVWLLDRPEERARLSEATYRRVTGCGHSYHSRLQSLLAAQS